MLALSDVVRTYFLNYLDNTYIIKLLRLKIISQFNVQIYLNWEEITRKDLAKIY